MPYCVGYGRRSVARSRGTEANSSTEAYSRSAKVGLKMKGAGRASEL